MKMNRIPFTVIVPDKKVKMTVEIIFVLEYIFMVNNTKINETSDSTIPKIKGTVIIVILTTIFFLLLVVNTYLNLLGKIFLDVQRLVSENYSIIKLNWE
jgi:hypothetical protein